MKLIVNNLLMSSLICVHESVCFQEVVYTKVVNRNLHTLIIEGWNGILPKLSNRSQDSFQWQVYKSTLGAYSKAIHTLFLCRLKPSLEYITSQHSYYEIVQSSLDSKLA